MYILAVYLAKFIQKFITLFNLGAGLTWPGHVALAMYPALFSHKQLFPKSGVFYISATNGKTTTTKLISHILREYDRKVISNESGANLLNGIATSLLLTTNLFGKSKAEFGVFEVDEFTLPSLLARHVPEVLLLLNLSRDQLDRYGETDTILDRWQTALSKLDSSVHLLIDSTQRKFDDLPKIFKGTTYYFDDFTDALNHTSLTGDFNAKNLNAALLAVSFFGYQKAQSLQKLKNFRSAWGRGELITHNTVKWRLFLAKNPMSFNTNLEMLAKYKFNSSKILVILNDNIPDGRDVSWIYDIKPEKLHLACEGKTIYIAGSRAFDMATRLEYAQVPVIPSQVIPDVASAVNELEKAVHSNSDEEILVLPNYSAMLSLRKVLIGKSIL